MKEIEVGNVYNLKGTEKSYTVSNIEVYLSTDIFEKDEKTITLNSNATGYEIGVPLDVFWNMFEHKRDIKSKKVYLAGDMLHKSLFEYRKQQKNEIEKIEGLEVYNPSSNDDINSKKTAKKEKLAERIVEQDTVAIENADIYVIDVPTADAGGRGTVAEIGQIFQMKRDAENLLNYDLTPELLNHVEDVLKKPVFMYSDDIRWDTADMSDHPDRVPSSFNAYVYGQVQYLTKGKGIISWEEVLLELERLGQQD